MGWGHLLGEGAGLAHNARPGAVAVQDQLRHLMEVLDGAGRQLSQSPDG